MNDVQKDYIMVLTFDLHGATNEYGKIRNDLESILGLNTGLRKEVNINFVKNTFTGRFSPENYSDAVMLKEHLITEIERIFQRYNVNAKYFLVVAKDWTAHFEDAPAK
jgi:hypothetical protein